MSVSYSKEIKNLFRKKDVNAMSMFGGFNLHNYDDVKARAGDILTRLEDGSMPCDGAWIDENVSLFRRWIENGMLP